MFKLANIKLLDSSVHLLKENLFYKFVRCILPGDKSVCSSGTPAPPIPFSIYRSRIATPTHFISAALYADDTAMVDARRNAEIVKEVGKEMA